MALSAVVHDSLIDSAAHMYSKRLVHQISNEFCEKIMMINLMKSLSNILSFFFRLAWESRIRLPVILTVWFMVLDVRMQLEINVNLGQNQIDA
ncbi:unnamed protein product [Larinioides sclopetarius]|uniref:Uncharacterized protein n=1 Tax=Larinioides sclopetarius TaxID=280406 RepID=A0AAV2B251_9ARAC